MDIDMDVDDGSTGIDLGAVPQQVVQETSTSADEDRPMPAAYFENLDARPVEQWPEFINIQGVNDFDPNDALYYAMEHCSQVRAKQLLWVNDSSINLQYYSAQDAGLALQALTDPSAGDPAFMSAETSRKARPYSKRPDLTLIIRQANAGDQKAKGAATRSNYYRQNPDVRGGDRESRGDRGGRGGRGYRGRERPPRRRSPPPRDYLDYDEAEPKPYRRPSLSGDDSMRDGSDFDNRRIDRRNSNRERGGRLNDNFDSYRPSTQGPHESRFGRLRGRSASPGSGDEGDGRYGFTEQGTSTRTRYRSRSRSRNPRRRREPSGERWTHDRANFGERGHSVGGRWTKDSSTSRYIEPSPSMSNHRRSDAFDESATGKGSLLSRMTKDGQPLGSQKRSLASRITRDDDDAPEYGRLKDDYSAVRDVDFSEPAPKRGLASRITRDDDDVDGINIRGTAAQNGFSIRGVAGGT